MLFEVTFADGSRLEYPDGVTFQFEAGGVLAIHGAEDHEIGDVLYLSPSEWSRVRQRDPGARTDVSA